MLHHLATLSFSLLDKLVLAEIFCKSNSSSSSDPP